MSRGLLQEHANLLLTKGGYSVDETINILYGSNRDIPKVDVSSIVYSAQRYLEKRI